MAAIKNPQFDNRMWSSPTLGLAQAKQGYVHRGAIVRDEDTYDSKFKDRHEIHFLFNPSTIQISHSTGAVLDSTKRATDGNYVGMSGIGTLQFSLLFDRTYEMYQSMGDNQSDKSPLVKGVLTDIEAFYRVTGVYDVTAKGDKATQIQPMQSYGCMFYLGGAPLGYSGPALLSYSGYVSSLIVSYTHFSRDMVPMRCGVDVTAELIMK